MKASLITLALLFASSSSFASLVDVNHLNKILKAQNAGWTAKSTPINDLSREEIQHRLGVPGMQDEAVIFKLPQTETPNLYPSKVDWRDNNGNWVSPVLDQANCGSCVAFATVATLETQYKIASGFPSFNIKLSPQFLFSCGGGWCDLGWQPENAAQFLKSRGVPDESCMPYLGGATGKDIACSAACPDSSQRLVKIANYTTPTRLAADLNALRAALQRGPLVTTLGVYADFMTYSSGVYKHVTGQRMGGHAVSIIGYDDSLQAFIIRNSWGESWGENGFAYISYEDISGIGVDTWAFQMSSFNGAVTVEGPIDYTYVSGSLQVKAHSTYAGTDSITVSAFGSKGTAAFSVVTSGGDINQAADVSQMSDGRYEVQALAFDKAGHQLGVSTRQILYVVNKPPTLSLSFTGTNGTDLNKPLKGRMQIAITATSSSVPMSSVEFHYRGPDGKDVSRSAAVVVDGMSMGWRTNIVPNGQYEIWMVGHVKSNTTDTVVTTPHQTVSVSN